MNGKVKVELQIPVKIVKVSRFSKKIVVEIEAHNGERVTLYENDTLNINASAWFKNAMNSYYE